eukprot:167331_1
MAERTNAKFTTWGSFAEVVVLTGGSIAGVMQFIEEIRKPHPVLSEPADIVEFVTLSSLITVSWVFYAIMHCQDFKGPSARPNCAVRIFSVCYVLATQEISTRELTHEALISRRLLMVGSYQFLGVIFQNSFYHYSNLWFSIIEVLMFIYDASVMNDVGCGTICINTCKYIFGFKTGRIYNNIVDDNGKPVFGPSENQNLL